MKQSNFERKFSRYTISNLSLYLVIGYAIGYAIYYLFPDLYEYITFDPYLILHGQIWRIVTWVVTMPATLGLFTIIMLFFYYSVGNNLEYTWGKYRYNVYIFSGMLFTIIGAFLLYAILIIMCNTTGEYETVLNAVGMSYSGTSVTDLAVIYRGIGMGIGNFVSTYYINMSIFLAFAATYPDAEVLLYFIIPIKVKWLGVLYGAFIFVEILQGSWVTRMMVITSLLNFMIFFFQTRNKLSPYQIKRKREYRKNIRQATQPKYENGAKHKCAICGRTELDDPNLTFRYCSKCSGNKEYCQDHLFTHTHC